MNNNQKTHEALGKILRCLEWMFNNTDDKSVQGHLAEPISLAKSALAETPEPTGNAKTREGCITFTEAIEHMRRGAMIREKGTTLWTWRGTSGRCYYGLKRNHPLQFKDTFLCAEVFGDGEWEVKDEAAYKREREATTEKYSPVGNNSKMRGVLKNASERLRKATESERYGEDVLYLVGCMRSVALELQSALAAPPRNCDLYETESERRAAFIDWYNETFDLKGDKYAIETCDLKHDVEGILHEYIDWLFAKAEGKTK